MGCLHSCPRSEGGVAGRVGVGVGQGNGNVSCEKLEKKGIGKCVEDREWRGIGGVSASVRVL